MMQKDHTPAEIRHNRTVYRLTSQETADALHAYICGLGEAVPIGEKCVQTQPTDAGGWRLALVVDHCDPPPGEPERKEADA